MSLIGAPLLLAKTYNNIVMEKDLGVNALSDGLSSRYIKSKVLTLINRSKERDLIENKLISMGLSKEETYTSILALSKSHDRLFLSKPFARTIVKDLGLSPSPPFVILVDSMRRGIIRPKEFSILYEKMSKLEEGR